MVRNSFDIVNPVLNDEDMIRIGEEILAELKTAFVRVAMGYEMPTARDTWESIIKERFDELEKINPMRQQRAIATLRRIGETPKLRRAELGRFADLNLQSPNLLIKTSVSPKIRTHVKRLETLAMRNVAFPFHPVVRVFPESFDPTIMRPQQTYKYTGVKFMMDKVYCVDETGWDWWGSDEIWMGGTSIDETGDVKKISAWEVHGDFDTGETKNYSPDKQVHWFNVKEGGDNWPKHYFVYLVMAERDAGDFPDWITKLYKKVKEKLTHYIATVGGAVVGGAVGGPLGAVIGAIVGWIAGWVLDKVFGWIKSLWEDDLIAKCTYHLTHVGPQATFGGSARSSVAAVNYYGGSGKYRVWTYWELFNY